MSKEFDLIAEFREDRGKGASRRLRRLGKVPAVIYGAGRPPRSVSLEHNKVLQQLDNESFYSSILSIKVGDKDQAAILKDVQRHPSKPEIYHLDLQRIVAGEKIRMQVPLHFLGEDVAPGVKEGGVVSHLMTEISITCLPEDLPEYLELDISELDMDAMLHLSNVPIPDGVEIPELAQGEDHDHAVVTIHRPRAAPVEDEEAETEEITDEADAEAPAPDADAGTGEGED